MPPYTNGRPGFFKRIINRIRAVFYKPVIKPEDKFRDLLIQLSAVMSAVDTVLKEKKYSRQQRKYFWKTFFKNGEFRKEVLEDVLKNDDLTKTLNIMEVSNESA